MPATPLQLTKEKTMRLDVRAMAIAVSILWGACVLFVGIVNAMWPAYGQAFLELCASIYPGYHPSTNFGSVLVGTLYALVDGAFGGAIFGWLYNRCAKKFSS
jgi:hypothetical protein